MKPKTTEIIFSPYFHFKPFPPLSHTHSSLTHALHLSKLHCSDPHTEPNGTTHTDAPRSKLYAVDAAKLRSTPHRRTSNDPSSDPLHTVDETSSDPLQALEENHSDPLHAVDKTSSDPQTSSDPLHPLDESSSDPLHAQNDPSSDLVDVPICTNALDAHDPSSDSVDAHGEFSFSVSHSDPLIFLRSTLISPVHSFSISGRQPHFSDPQIITSVLTPTHCDACSLLLFLLLLYINFLGI